MPIIQSTLRSTSILLFLLVELLLLVALIYLLFILMVVSIKLLAMAHQAIGILDAIRAMTLGLLAITLVTTNLDY
jgi:hypothetical protein